jgi:hypothetical protein
MVLVSKTRKGFVRFLDLSTGTEIELPVFIGRRYQLASEYMNDSYIRVVDTNSEKPFPDNIIISLPEDVFNNLYNSKIETTGGFSKRKIDRLDPAKKPHYWNVL